MKRQKAIRIVGFALMIFAIFLMTYKIITETKGETDYIVYGLLLTVIGMFLAQYGEKK